MSSPRACVGSVRSISRFSAQPCRFSYATNITKPSLVQTPLSVCLSAVFLFLFKSSSLSSVLSHILTLQETEIISKYQSYHASIHHHRICSRISSSSSSTSPLPLRPHQELYRHRGRLRLWMVCLQHRLQHRQQEHAQRIPLPLVSLCLSIGRLCSLHAFAMGNQAPPSTQSFWKSLSRPPPRGILPHSRPRLRLRFILPNGRFLRPRG